MKQKEVFKKIGGIIKELGDQYEYLQTMTEDLNDLELELFVSNAHFLTDHIEILCKLNLQNKRITKSAAEKPEITYEQKFFEPVVQQMKTGAAKQETKLKDELKPIEPEIIIPEVEQPVTQIDLKSESPEDTYSFIREEPETIRHELILDEASMMEDEEEYRHIENKSEASPAKENEEPLIADNKTAGPIVSEDLTSVNNKGKKGTPNIDTEAEVITINQKMSAQDKTTSKTEQPNIKPISDIKLAITLNDKLLYVKDLFNGYNLAYSEAIEILNRFNTFEEASRFLKTNYVTKNNWDSKPATTEKFYALLKRRYA
ncbi:MAG: hypothetical protein JWQ84_481 [Mucilaginibacter sp.]|nr:hypothetical protein [Mucilaginibacter sp.]MDB5138544.1 hypothetical protein [Mucilaginibacter sp.]